MAVSDPISFFATKALHRDPQNNSGVAEIAGKKKWPGGQSRRAMKVEELARRSPFGSHLRGYQGHLAKDWKIGHYLNGFATRRKKAPPGQKISLRAKKTPAWWFQTGI
jgi:hypothetical protein